MSKNEKCTIAWLHIPADNIERAQKFYNEIFGWEFEKIENANQAWLIKGCQPNGKEDYRLHQRRYPGQTITQGINVSSVEEYAEKVKTAGGKVVQVMQIPKTGWFAICQDTEGNVFSLWEEIS
ncbi:MAG: hypothetical protein K940chlam1_01185 [Candidatus Anoxychlamydiales bacterium]|nr:hypothetical protein [Candidatus Anoxychlamydiales bacterium]NGX35393.1 hypothetical protein [Candidatus Anoxychlamydiales bacterium]